MNPSSQRRQNHSRCALAALSAVCCLTAASSLAASGPVLLKPPSVFPITISSPGSYALRSNLTVPGATPAITITADNVTLDLNGFSINGAGGAAVGIHGISAPDPAQRNITVRNGIVRNFAGDGINLQGRGHTVQDIKASDNASTGITISEGSTVQRCVSTANSVGIGTGTGCHVLQNVCSSNTVHGISVAQANTVSQNTCANNLSAGIEAQGRALLSENTCSFNDAGIDASGDATIKGNNCTANTTIGIGVVNDCFVLNNHASSNGSIGIFAGGSRSVISDNICTKNGSDGIKSAPANSRNVITRNACTGNTGAGINLTVTGTGAFFMSNITGGNTGGDIIDATGDTEGSLGDEAF